MDKYEHTDPEHTPEMRQLITEALLRDSGTAPDADAEWERLIRRQHPRKTQVWARPVAWLCTAAAVAVTLLVMVHPFADTDKTPVTVYQANTQHSEVVVIGQRSTDSDKKTARLAKSVQAAAEMQTIVVPPGQIWQGTLADGTRIWLNADTRLTYPTVFSGFTREVMLQGEAYFEVAHDSRHPFLVHAGNQVTRVLGTRFDIDSYHSEVTHVTLLSGCVRVEPETDDAAAPSAASPRTLTAPGESAKVTSSGIGIRRVNVEDVACWREGIELFDDASLRDILFHIGAWYNMTVVCHDRACLGMRLHYVYDRNSSITENLKMLENISQLEFRIEDNTIFAD